MAKLHGLDVTKNNGIGQVYGYNEQLGIYCMSLGGDWSSKYVHLKTNQNVSMNQITTIEAVGYNYGTSQPIRCMWSFYVYPTTGLVHDKGMSSDDYSGMTADGIYKSSDGYAVIRGYMPSHYVCGAIFNAYTSGAGSHPFGAKVDITAYTVTDNGGTVY